MVQQMLCMYEALSLFPGTTTLTQKKGTFKETPPSTTVASSGSVFNTGPFSWVPAQFWGSD